MATLPYIQLYVSDYLADTQHLTTEEHGAYLLLIMNYWQTEKPIPQNRLQGITRVFNDRWDSVKQNLNEFFKQDENNAWYHERIHQDLDRVKAKSKQASRAGKKSAEIRAKKKALNTDLINDSLTTVEKPLSECLTIEEEREKKKEKREKNIEIIKEKSLADKTIDYLNLKANKSYGYVDAHIKLINARIKDGATEEQLAYVIDVKVKEWINNLEYKKYLRPSTLFASSKFDGYLNQDMVITKDDKIEHYINNNIYDSIAQATAEDNKELLNG